MNQDKDQVGMENGARLGLVPGQKEKAGSHINGNGYSKFKTNGVDGKQKENASHRTSKGVIALEKEYSAHNYHPLPIVFARAKGARVWDPEGKEYIDCLSAYSAMNQVQ